MFHDVILVFYTDLHYSFFHNSCETRPGPSFLTRRYKFHSDHSFTFYQFYYSDNQCQSPAYSYRVRGQLTIGGLTFTLDGANEALYELEKVTLTVFQDRFAMKLAQQLNGSCPGMLEPNQPLAIFRKYIVLDNSRDVVQIDCTPGLGFTMNELQLIRQEVYERRVEDTGTVRRSETLYLGDIHTDPAQMIIHRSKGYQTPLRKYDDDSENYCAVCQIVYNAREHAPPILPRIQHENIALSGGWVSVHCEVRHIYFLTRHLIFFDNQTWEGHYHFYRDPLCQFPKYTVSVKGTRTAGEPSAIVEGATNFKFTSLAMYLTPQCDKEVERFNSKNVGCGRRGAWKVGRTLDVTSAGGCDVLGVNLPHMEFELVKTVPDPEEGLLLFTGQRPSDGQTPNTESLRATSFQSPLLHCSDEDPYEVQYTENSGDTNSSCDRQVKIATSNIILLSVLLLVITSAVRWRSL
ncbi:protein APCDD1-like [Strongylocentrotus purpuratus]|uniref:APCDD1 domain-containing protein n=1 Tax=Strongylocentrotus purpuratus TaxID=7668 RepID=A0A7M7N751_STRPU|nr:protein APCDD1-like [Strongylocentrotus purpuratus]